MTPTRLLSGIALAVFAMAGTLATSPTAKAEDLVDFLWGGTEEFGGGRQITSFNPQYKPGQVIVSFSDRRLYFINAPGKAITYPVAVPTGEARWQGVTFVSNKRINPSWTPTPEMVRANPRLPRWVPGGHPMNPLGVRAMYLGSSAYRIHGTDAPWTIGQAVSHGCIRMTNEDVLDLYPRIPVGMRVTVTWQSFSTHAVSSNEPVYGPNDDGSNGKNRGGSYAANTSSDAGASNFSDDYDKQGGEPARKTSSRSETGLSMWDQDNSGAAQPKKKAAREEKSKASRSNETASTGVTKAVTSSEEKPTITKAVATSEKTIEEPTVLSSTSEKPQTPKSSSTSESKSAAKTSSSSSSNEKAAEKTEASKSSATSHPAKTVAKNFKPVSDPVAIKKPAPAEKSSSNGKTDKHEADKTALAN